VNFAQFLKNADLTSQRPIPLKELAAKHRLRIKNKHTIVPPWLYRASEKITRKEFNVLFAESTCGHERYVELSRA
jgi:hypothetical protein